MATARNVVLDAYVNSGMKGLNQSVEGDEFQLGLNQLNKIIDDLNNQNLLSYSTLSYTGTLVNGQSEYTIGETGEIVGPIPNVIVAFSLLQDNFYRPLSPMSRTEFLDTTRTLNQIGNPTIYTYNKTLPNATIELYPIPTEALPFRVDVQSLMVNYGSNDVIELPVGYLGYLEDALAVRLCNLNRSPNPVLEASANKRLANIKTQNLDIPRLSLGAMPRGRSRNTSYNIRTNQGGY